MYRNAEREREAAEAASFIRRKFGYGARPDEPVAPTAVVLGTGWSNRLPFKESAAVPLKFVPGFSALGEVAGHARVLRLGFVGDRKVLVLDGRVHLNEAPGSPETYRMVRLQAELLFRLGVNKLVLTAAVGSLETFPVGSVVVIDGFITLYAPDMPLWGGEFCSPEDALSVRFQQQAFSVPTRLPVFAGSHAMVRGPFFEGRRYDKALLKKSGASVVGMSILPEACIAALYGVPVLGLAFVTNTASEEHSHEENQRRAQENAAELGDFLAKTIQAL